MENTTMIGIDVSKASLDIFIAETATHFQIENNPKEIKKVLKKIKTMQQETLLVCEATGGYERLIIRLAQTLKIAVGMANPKRVRDYARAKGILAKNDKIDARIIAEFASQIGVNVCLTKSSSEAELEEYRRRHSQLKDALTSEKNRLDKTTNKDIVRLIQDSIKHLEKQCEAVDKKLEDLIAQDETLCQKRDILCSLPGVGKITAATLLSELPELGKISNKAIASLVGVAPFCRDSGTLQGKRSIYGGKRNLRCMLYMATLSAIRHSAPIKAFYTRLVQAGKVKKVAIVSCMRKVITMLNSMIKNNSLWQENYGHV